MKSILKKVGLIVLSIICFLVAKELVQLALESQRPTSVIGEDAEEAFYRVAAEQGVEPGAAKEIVDSTKAVLNNKATMTELKQAYGIADNRTIKETRIHLNEHPERKAQVGNALVTSIRKGFLFPARLDDHTSLTGVHYSESTESVVYHYSISDEVVSQFEGEFETLKKLLSEDNPDAVCKISLDLLGQGFDMTYSYRDLNGKELFNVVRTYEGCEAMGYNEHS